MSERTATWRIVTEFAKARKDSDKLARSLERLDADRERLDKDTVKGNQDVEKSLSQRNKATETYVKQAKAAQKVEQESVKTLDDVAKATDRETVARKRGLTGLVQTLAAKKKNAVASRLAARQSEIQAAAEQKLAQIELRRKAALLALTAAEERHTAAVKKSGIFSNQAAKALLSYERRTLDVTRVEEQHSSVLRNLENDMRRVENETRRTSNSSGGLGGRLRSLAGDFFDVGKSVSFFGRMLSFLKFPAIIAGVGQLIGLLGNLGAGILSLLGPLSSLGGLLAALPAGFAVMGGVLGTFMAALGGVGQALQAHTAMQNAAARQTAAGTKAQNAQTAATNRLKKAQKALAAAQKELNKAQKEQQQTAAALAKAQQKAAKGAGAQHLANGLVKKQTSQLHSVLNDPNSTKAQKAAAKKALAEAKRAQKEIAKERAADAKKAKAAENKDQKARDKVAKAQQKVNRLQNAQTKAQKALTKANKAAAGSTGAAATAANLYQQALAKLTPEGRRFVQVLLKAKEAFKQVQDAAQRGLLPGLGDAILILLKLIPMVSQAVYTFGTIIGATAKKGAKIATSGPFTKMFGRIIKSNEKLLRMAGKAFLNIFQALIYVMDAARPFSEWLGKTVLGWTKWIKGATKAGDKTGRMADFLDRTKQVLKILGGTFKNLFGTFKGIGKAGMDLGMDLLRSFRRITKGWSDWTNSTKGQNQLKKWFDNARKPLHQTAGLIGDLVKWWFKFSSNNKNTAPLIKQIRKELLPAVETLVETLSGDFATQLVDALSSIAKLITDLTAGGGGGLTAFVKSVGQIANFLDWIVTHVPGAQGAISLLVGSLGALAAIRFVGAISGFSKLLKLANASRKTGAIAGLLGKEVDPKKAGVGVKVGKAVRSKGGKALKAVGGKAKSLFGIGPKDAEGEGRSLASRFGKALQNGLSKVRGLAQKAGARIGNALSSGASKAGKTAKTISSNFGKALKTAGGKLKVLGSKLGKGLMDKARLAITKGTPVVKSAMSKMGGFLSKTASTLVSGFGRMVSGIGSVLGKLVGIVGKAMLAIGRVLMANPWLLLVAALIIVTILIVKHWDKVKKIVSKAVNWIVNFIKKHWDIIKYFVGPMAVVITLIVKHWDKIKSIFSKAIAWVVNLAKKVWGGITDLVTKPLSDAKDVLDGIWDKIHTAFSNGFSKIRDLATSFKSGFAKIWDDLKRTFGSPIEWIINTVIGDWLVGNFNKVLRFLHMDPIDAPHVDFAFARGGMVPGEGNRDSVPAVLMPGEYVLRKDAVKRIGLTTLTQMNEGRTVTGRQKFARGGEVGSSPANPAKFGLGGAIGGALHGAGHLIHTAGGKVVNLARSGAAKGLEEAFKPIRSLVSNNPFDGIMHDIPVGIFNTLSGAMVDFVRGKKPPKKPVHLDATGHGHTTSQPHTPGTQLSRGGYLGRQQDQGINALLTPGEFVLNAAAVRRLGVGRLNKMNTTQKFARGGYVRHRTASMFGLGGSSSGANFGALMSPRLSNLSARARPTAVSSASRLAGLGVSGHTTVNYNTEVYNPMPERASDSVSKAVRRKTVRNGWST